MTRPLLNSVAADRSPSVIQPRLEVTAIAPPWLLRTVLLLGVLLAVALAVRAANPAGYLQADPMLARLLRGMAAIKGFVVLAAVGALLWRFGQSVSAAAAVGYCASAWAMTAATVLIWELTRVPLEAVVFHVGLIGFLMMAWRDENSAVRIWGKRPISMQPR